jgi:uncharacterized iron-regulated membrane protein
MNFRTLLFWLHLTAGCIIGTVILIISVTGMMLAFRSQIIGFVDRGYRSVAPAANAGAPDIERVLAAAAAAIHSPPSSVTLRSDPSAPAEVTVGRDRVLLVDAYSGKVLGESTAQAFFRNVEVWHRWLGAHDEDHRAIGHAIKSGCNLIFLFMIVSGLYLWIPRKWTWSHVRAVAIFRSGLTGRARDFNWHNVIGLWCALPLLVISITGVVMSYQWANDLLFRLTGTPPPARNADSSRRGQHGEPNWAGLNPVWMKAEQQVPGWRILTLRLPASNRAPLTFTIDTGDGGRPDQRSQLVLNRRTAEVIRFEAFSGYSAGRQLRTWFRFIHTGEAGGIVGRTVAAFAAAGTAMMVWTGFWLAGRRFLRWRKREQAKAESTTARTATIA